VGPRRCSDLEPDSFAEKILWLLAHPEEARAMGQSARARVRECFSAEAMAAQTLAVYRMIMDGAK
ncbi:MAG: glycosyltransferase family protein, partial [Anaerolineae bacterium]